MVEQTYFRIGCVPQEWVSPEAVTCAAVTHPPPSAHTKPKAAGAVPQQLFGQSPTAHLE